MGLFAEKNNLGKGRPKGSSNKVNVSTKKILADILEHNVKDIQEDIDALDSKDRLTFILNLASFVVPKLKSVEVQGEVSHHNMLGLNTEEIIELEAEITNINEGDEVIEINNGWKKKLEIESNSELIKEIKSIGDR